MNAPTPARRGAARGGGNGRERILASADYPSFRAALADFDCRLCPLHEGRTRIVVDRGSPRARVLLIGEGPGAEEDRRGLAFVGRSGRLLDEMLRQAGLEPEDDVLIANVVKCRPPRNRAPLADEVAACRPWLERQIELAGPRRVALLGATAVRHVLSSAAGKAMKELAGRFFEDDRLPGTDVLVTFHPAYVLRTPAMRPEMVSHLRRLRAGPSAGDR